MKTPSITILLLLCFTAFISAQDMGLEAEVKPTTNDEMIEISEEGTDTDSTTVADPQEMDKKTRASGLAVNIVQNNVGGFFPVFLGHVNLKPNLNATWYSVFWTNPSFGTLDVGGDLWLETGAGLGFSSKNVRM